MHIISVYHVTSIHCINMFHDVLCFTMSFVRLPDPGGGNSIKFDSNPNHVRCVANASWLESPALSWASNHTKRSQTRWRVSLESFGLGLMYKEVLRNVGPMILELPKKETLKLQANYIIYAYSIRTKSTPQMTNKHLKSSHMRSSKFSIPWMNMVRLWFKIQSYGASNIGYSPKKKKMNPQSADRIHRDPCQVQGRKSHFCWFQNPVISMTLHW